MARLVRELAHALARQAEERARVAEADAELAGERRDDAACRATEIGDFVLSFDARLGVALELFLGVAVESHVFDELRLLPGGAERLLDATASFGEAATPGVRLSRRRAPTGSLLLEDDLQLCSCLAPRHCFSSFGGSVVAFDAAPDSP